MDYLYQLPDEDREEEGHNRASNYALADFLKLDLKGVPAEKITEFITDAWWDYVEKSDLTEEEVNDLLEKTQAERGGHIPYSPGHPARFAGLVECTPLYRLETSLNVWVTDKEQFFYVRPIDALHVRYYWQILQERVHELTIGATPEVHHIKIPRLNAAIEWLKGYEQRLAVAQQAIDNKKSPLAWLGSKAELAELGYSLLESGTVEAANRAAAVKKLGELFGVALGANPAAHLQTIQKRKTGAVLTPLLDKLKTAFAGYLEKKTENETQNRATRRR